MFKKIIYSQLLLCVLSTGLLSHGFVPETLMSLNTQDFFPLNNVMLNSDSNAIDAWDMTERAIAKQEVEVDRLIAITLDNGEQIICSQEQQFCCLVSDGQNFLQNGPAIFDWRDAQVLTSGDRLLALSQELSVLRIQRVEVLDVSHKSEKIIRLTTQPCHVFCVTQSLVLVHNFDQRSNNQVGFSVPLLGVGMTALVSSCWPLLAPLAIGFFATWRLWSDKKQSQVHEQQKLLAQQQALAEQNRLQQQSWLAQEQALAQRDLMAQCKPLQVAACPASESANNLQRPWPVMPPLEKGPFLALNLEQKQDGENNTWLRMMAENQEHINVGHSAWSIFDPEGFWTKSVTDDGFLLAMAGPDSRAQQAEIISDVQALLQRVPNLVNDNAAANAQNLQAWQVENNELLQSLMAKVDDLQNQVNDLQHQNAFTNSKEYVVCCLLLNLAGLGIGNSHLMVKILYTAIVTLAPGMLYNLYQSYFFPQNSEVKEESLKEVKNNRLLAFTNQQGNLWAIHQGQCIDFNFHSQEGFSC